MSTLTICLIIFGCLFGLFLLWILIGTITFFVSLRKGCFAGKIINGGFRKKLESYNIDYSWWDKVKTEKIVAKSGKEKLSGVILRRSSNKVAICVHGIFGFYKDMSPQAKFLYEQDYNILAIDLRSHGETTGKYVSMGFFEKDDIVAWTIKAKEIFGATAKIVLLGISMGAATVILASGENLPKNVKCVVADSGYKDAYNQLEYVCKKKLHIPPFLVLPVANVCCKIFAKFDLKRVKPIDAVRKTNLPILFFHGSQDRFVPCHMSKDMFAVSDKTKCELFITEGAGHVQSYAKNKENYQKTLISFLNRWTDE